MTVILKIFFFLLGMALAVQWVGVVFGIIDLWYRFRSAYWLVLRRILVWSIVVTAAALLAGPLYRPVFLWGIAAYGIFITLFFWLGKILGISVIFKK